MNRLSRTEVISLLAGVPPATCSAVPGKISPKGWCVAYQAKS